MDRNYLSCLALEVYELVCICVLVLLFLVNMVIDVHLLYHYAFVAHTHYGWSFCPTAHTITVVI